MSLVLEHSNFEEHMKILAGHGVVVDTNGPIFTKDRGTGEPVKIFRANEPDDYLKRTWLVCFIDGSSSYFGWEQRSNFAVSYDISYTDRYFWENKFRVKRVECLAGLPELTKGLYWKVEVCNDITDTTLTLQVVDDKKEVVVSSSSVILPMTEELFFEKLGKLSKEMNIPEYNPFELNW